MKVEIWHFLFVKWPRCQSVTWHCQWNPLNLRHHPALSLGSIGLVKVEIKRFWFITWPRVWCVTWICRWGPLILSHHLVKFRVSRPCKSGDITFLFVTWPRYWSATWVCGWVPLILNHHPTRWSHLKGHVTHQPNGHVTNQKRYISTFPRPMDPKLSRLLT